MPSDPDTPPAPESILADFLARLEHSGQADIDQLCADHPEREGELRHAWAEHQLALGALRRGATAWAPAPETFTRARTNDVLGDFRLLELLGQGGMGQVWSAEDRALQRTVALKLVRPELVNERSLALFAREARAGGRLQHPHIVAVHAHGESDGVAWIAMEYVDGARTLRDALDDAARGAGLPAEYYHDAAVLMRKLATALAAAHEAGVIHRDLKPQNVLLTADDEPKVTDFGLARITDESALSATGELAGTYAYMSPEQVAARRIGIDHRTDVFSLGVVMYEILALRRPFEGDTPHQVASRILVTDPPDPRQLRSRVPRDLAVICGKCLEKQPDRRYQTMSELAADLQRHIANEPILAHPPAPLQRASKWARRHPTATAVGAVGALALAAISLLLLDNLRANSALRTERSNLERKTREAEDAADRERAAAKSERARADQVLRLSAFKNLDELRALAGDLWPPHPQRIDDYRRWLADAERLVATLDEPDPETGAPSHRAQLEALRARARPMTEAAVEEARRKDPRSDALERARGRLASLRRAREVREGRAAPAIPDLEHLPPAADSGSLMAQAWPLVSPDREAFGREGEGVALLRRAMEVVQDDAEFARICEGLAWANFAVGLDDEAVAEVEGALPGAGQAEASKLEEALAELQAAIAAARGENGAALIREAEQTVADMELAVDGALEREFEDDQDAWWFEQLRQLVAAIEAFADEEAGLLGEGVSAEHGWGVAHRLAFAQRVRDGLEGGESARRWEEAAAAIQAHPDYAGLALSPQMGLVPIGTDPDSGLWEFWHVATGEEPVRDATGRLEPTEESGLVLVLLPGGTFWMGAQRTDPEKPHFDLAAARHESPVREVTLSPFFLSKYEMTQGQWLRFTGFNPSYYGPGFLVAGHRHDLRHPVELLSWNTCRALLPRMGLELPSEAQWEYAARARTDTPWWTGRERESLREQHAANLADQAAARGGRDWVEIQDWPELDDGFGAHAPVGTFAANGFGLHEVHGNVWEWCLDGNPGFYVPTADRDPVALHSEPNHVLRGGSFGNTAAFARSAFRTDLGENSTDPILGVRPAAALQ